jgi:hypothetical protein
VSREDFISHYEKNHAPLATQILPGMCGYRRNFVIPNGMFSAGHIGDAAAEPGFNVVTEAWFESRADYEKMVKVTQDPSTIAPLADDEKMLFDTRSEAMIMFLVDERATPDHELSVSKAKAGEITA